MGQVAASSSETSVDMVSKGSALSPAPIELGGSSVGGKIFSPIVEAESRNEGDDGGGDCTRTFLVAFFGGCIDSGIALAVSN